MSVSSFHHHIDPGKISRQTDSRNKTINSLCEDIEEGYLYHTSCIISFSIHIMPNTLMKYQVEPKEGIIYLDYSGSPHMAYQ
jgi:hypothetical protein